MVLIRTLVYGSLMMCAGSVSRAADLEVMSYNILRPWPFSDPDP